MNASPALMADQTKRTWPMARAGRTIAAETVAQPTTIANPRAAPAGFTGWALYPWVVLFASTLVQTTASLGNQLISPIAPFLVDDLGVSRQQIGLLVTAAYVVACFVLILAGGLSDRFGVRNLFLIGMVLAGIPLALEAAMPSYVWLLVPMALFGLGNGFALPPTTRAIVEWFPTNRRGLAMGIKQTGVALAGVICGFIVPPLGQAYGWRGTFLILGAFTVVAGVLSWVLYRDRPVESVAVAPRPGYRVVLRNRNLLLLSGVTFLYAGVQLSLVGFLVLFLRERAGMSLLEAGAMLSFAQAGGVIGRICWGMVSDAFFGSRRKVIMGIIGVMAGVGMLAMAFVDEGTPRWVLFVILAVAGVSAIGWNGINMVFVSEIVGRGASATAAGVNLTASYLGIMVGPPLFGYLVDATGSYTSAFVAGAICSVVALVLLAPIRPATAG
jgi:sugar phosphate permease